MASKGAKAQRKLQRRIKDYDSIPNKESLSAIGLKMHKPGSQNLNK